MKRALRRLLTRSRIIHGRLSVQPFEAALAAFTLWVGLLLLLQVGPPRTPSPVTSQLPSLLVFAFRTLYFASGVGMFVGLGWGYRNIEVIGLIFFIASLGGFALTVLAVIGFKLVILGSVSFAVIFVIGASMRLTTLLKGKAILMVESK